MNETAVQSQELPDRVSCLIAPLSDRNLLLPVTAVSEVINTAMMPESGNDKTALYGWIHWRDQKIPLVSVENMMGGERPQLKLENRMAVINAVGYASGMGFYAVLLQGLPRPIQVNQESIRPEGGKVPKLSVAKGAIGEEQVNIPDLMAVESLVIKFKKK